MLLELPAEFPEEVRQVQSPSKVFHSTPARVPDLNVCTEFCDMRP